jgi:hypothetical protein
MSFIYSCRKCFACTIVWPLTLLFTGASHFLLQNRVDLHSAFSLANVHECLVNWFQLFFSLTRNVVFKLCQVEVEVGDDLAHRQNLPTQIKEFMGF